MVKINKHTKITSPTLVNAEEMIVSYGCTVHVITGPSVGRAYRFEGIVSYSARGTRSHVHRVKVSRKSVHGHFRAVEWLTPELLGCSVRIPQTRADRAKGMCHAAWCKVDDWIMAGVFALVPLAVFEHFHMASKITEIISLGMITSGGH